MSRDSIEDPWKETMNGEPRKDDEPQEEDESNECQMCGGSGQMHDFVCPRCDGEGRE